MMNVFIRNPKIKHMLIIVSSALMVLMLFGCTASDAPESGDPDENYELKQIYGMTATVELEPPDQRSLNKTTVTYEIIISGNEENIEDIDSYELMINMEYKDLLLEDGPHYVTVKGETDPYYEIIGSFVFDTEGKTQGEINTMDFLQEIKIIDKDREEWVFDL